MFVDFFCLFSTGKSVSRLFSWLVCPALSRLDSHGDPLIGVGGRGNQFWTGADTDFYVPQYDDLLRGDIDVRHSFPADIPFQ